MAALLRERYSSSRLEPVEIIVLSTNTLFWYLPSNFLLIAFHSNYLLLIIMSWFQNCCGQKIDRLTYYTTKVIVIFI